MKTLLLVILALLFCASAFAFGPGRTLYTQQIQISDQTWEISPYVGGKTVYDILIVNTSPEFPVYVSNYFFEQYSDSQTDPNFPGRIVWTVIPPNGKLDMQDLAEPLFAVCAQGQTARIGIVIRLKHE